ncbi:MAG: hypothetical protein J5I65_16430 [Aridibacter famidurans]|nr:hypothetical protein [Aridibacter famidurans]
MRCRYRSDVLSRPFFAAVVSALVAAAFLSSSSFAQAPTEEAAIPAGVVPPPLNIISKQEKESLEAERKISDRTKLALELMESRLKLSEDAATKEEFQESLNQLGRFQALVRDTARYLHNNEESKKSYKNFKRFEQSLREFIPRLELLRRALPFKYGYHVRVMMEYLRDARSNALEPFFDDTVIPEGGSRR